MSKALDETMVFYTQQGYYDCLIEIYARPVKMLNPQDDDRRSQVCAKTLQHQLTDLRDLPGSPYKNIL